MATMMRAWRQKQKGKSSTPEPEVRLGNPYVQNALQYARDSVSPVGTPEIEKVSQNDEQAVHTQKITAMVNSFRKELNVLENICDEYHIYELNPDVIRALLSAHMDGIERILGNVTGHAMHTKSTEILHCCLEFYESFGLYEKIDGIFSDIFPLLKIEKGSVVGLEDSIWDKETQKPDKIYISWLVDFVSFFARTGRMLDFAENITRILPWYVDYVPEKKIRMIHATIEILNRRSNFLEAGNLLKAWYTLDTFASTPADNPVRLQIAITKAGRKLVDSARRTFVAAFISGSIHHGLWHSETLKVLYYFGKALRMWNLHAAAGILQEECCLGSVYLFGIAHPRSKQALEELKLCNVSRFRWFDLHLFGQTNYNPEKKLSIVYEHLHLNTAIDLLQQIAETVEINYSNIKYIAEWHISAGRLKGHAIDRAVRICVECKHHLGEPLGISEALVDGARYQSDNRVSHTTIELVKFSENPAKECKLVLQSFEREENMAEHRKEAIYRKLTATGHMHFTRDVIAEQPALISEQDSEAVGTGAFAVVDSVKIGAKSYARKSVMLPRYNQKSIRKIIQNEIAIVRTLEHPHIVRVFLTYEDKFRFYIVMQPLADCDLEAYLQEHAQKPPTENQRLMVWQWMFCLSNTLAYIHFKGIRHKDIKPRNVLIKGRDVVFADFGSSHVFLDEGNSTTEGPSFGHTKVYCAPEVLTSGKRGRMSDIFSLGCVFTELAVWLSGRTIENWNQLRQGDMTEASNNTYSATLWQITRLMGLQQDNRELCGVYEWVIKPMLREDPKSRITAVQVSERVVSGYQHVYGRPEGFSQCATCKLDRWVDTANAGSTSVWSLDASVSTIEEED